MPLASSVKLSSLSVNKYILVISLLICLVSAKAQDSTMQTIGGILDNYFLAAETTDSTKRHVAFQALFTENGRVNSIVMNNDGSNRVKQGSWKTYVEKSMSYYNRFTPTFDEESREMDFYLELATVHCIVNQISKQKSTGKSFQESYWMQFDLVFLNNRWYIDNILWVNEIPSLSIEKALVTDTLLYRPD